MPESVATAAARRMQTATSEFVAVDFPMFLEWVAAVWEPGQHWALVGPTGEGKSTFAGWLLGLRKWVMALDPKGGDETLADTGFEKIYRMPLTSAHWDTIAEGNPLRLILTGSTRTNDDMARFVNLLRQGVEFVRASGGFTLYADEFQILADRRMFGLDKEIEVLLVAARSAGTSVVTSFQAMSWVPKASTRQATFVACWPTRDEDMIKAVAQTMGRRWQDVVAAVRELPPYHCLVIPKRVQAPIIITRAPKLDSRSRLQVKPDGRDATR